MSTKIQWTEETWNPIAGCSVVSPGCTNCYAMRRAAPRLSQNQATPQYHGTVKPSKGGYVWTGRIGIAADTAFLKPLRTKKPTMFFVNSMSDLFHEHVPDEVIDRIFAIMALCPQHTFQVLTKRSKRMREYLAKRSGDWADRWTRAVDFDRRPIHHRPDEYGRLLMRNYGPFPLPNVWLGVSVEDQTRADERIPDLLATPAAIRFISAEPLLGPVDITPYLFIYTHEDDHILGAAPASELPVLPFRDPVSTPAKDIATPRLDWVIVGGESGKGARPMHPDWARQIRDQCAAAGVHHFFKQWGNWLPWEPEHGPCWKSQSGRCEDHHALFPVDMDQDPKWDDGLWALTSEGIEHFAFQNVGTKRAGRLLDGVEHNAMPEALS